MIEPRRTRRPRRKNYEGRKGREGFCRRGAATTDPAATTGRANLSNLMPKKSKSSPTGLSSAIKQWFRVRAVGALGPGPWSDPVQVTVP